MSQVLSQPAVFWGPGGSNVAPAMRARYALKHIYSHASRSYAWYLNSNVLWGNAFVLRREHSGFMLRLCKEAQRLYSTAEDTEDREAFLEELRTVIREAKEKQSGALPKDELEQQRRYPDFAFLAPQVHDEAKGNTQEPKETNANAESAMSPKDTLFTLGLGSGMKDLHCMLQNLEETLRLQRIVSPSVCKQTAQTFEELGMLYHKSCDFTKALRYYHQARVAYESLAKARSQQTNTDIATANSSNVPWAVNSEKDLQGETLVVAPLPPPQQEASDASQLGHPESYDHTHTNASGQQEKESRRYGSYDVARCLSYLGAAQ